MSHQVDNQQQTPGAGPTALDAPAAPLNVTGAQFQRKTLPRDVARATQSVVTSVDAETGVHTVGMVNPLASLAYDQIVGALGLPRRMVRRESISNDEYEKLYRAAYRTSESTEALEGWASIGARREDRIDAQGIAWEYDEEEAAAELAAQDDGQPLRILDTLLLILQQAAKLGASDIFLTHEGKTGTVKVKLDGRVSPDLIRYDRAMFESMVNAALSRARLTSTDMDREFGDAKLHVRLDGNLTEYRLSSIPSAFGKSLCLRLNVNVITNMERLGFFPSQIDWARRGLARTEGMVCIAGPTGSGKSNTMQSFLFYLDDGTIIICQAGNPIEFVVPGWIQVSINKRERTWTKTMEQFMRHAPNVISPGEVRTSEEAAMALNGAATGHLLMTTIHATSAAKALSRWQMLGVDPYELSEHTAMIVSQRLPAALCAHCRIKVGDEYIAHDKYYNPTEPNTCPHCLGRGYSGRFAIGEIMLVTPRIKQLIAARASSDEIELAARQEGMMTIAEAGELNIRQGRTSRREIQRVLGQLSTEGLMQNEYTLLAA